MTGASPGGDQPAPLGSGLGAAGHFQTTLWTIVVHAGRGDSPEAREALAQLCQRYWYPLYAFVRRQGHQAHDAQDLTQAFFTRLLEKQALGQVDRAKGKFRSFLLASLKNFLSNEWDRTQAQKRGGGQKAGVRVISLDQDSAESRYGLEPSHEVTAERRCERRWALTLLDCVLAALRDEYRAENKAPLFDALKETLTGESGAAPYAVISERLGMTPGAIKVAAHRLRQRYRELVRAEVAQTVAGEGDVDDELRHMLTVLAE